MWMEGLDSYLFTVTYSISFWSLKIITSGGMHYYTLVLLCVLFVVAFLPGGSNTFY